MDIKRLERVLEEVLKIGEAVMLVGHAGVGKTSAVKRLARRTNRELKILILSQMEPGDLIGLPDKRGDETKFLKPDWFPKTNKAIVFLDEINRAHPLVRNAVMQLVLDKRVHNHVLPVDTWIVAAMNPADGYDVFDVDDPAFVDRFVWIWVENSEEDFVEYLKAKNLYIKGVEEIFKGKLQIDGERPSFSFIKNTPRAWERAMKIVKAFSPSEFKEVGFEVLSGILERESAKALFDFAAGRKSNVFDLPVEEILSMEPKERMKILPSLYGLLNKNPDKFFELVEKLPAEESSALIRYAIENSRRSFVSELSKRKPLLRRILKEQLKRRAI